MQSLRTNLSKAWATIHLATILTQALHGRVLAEAKFRWKALVRHKTLWMRIGCTISTTTISLMHRGCSRAMEGSRTTMICGEEAEFCRVAIFNDLHDRSAKPKYLALSLRFGEPFVSIAGGFLLASTRRWRLNTYM
jgi:hypothetical protein